MKHIETANMFAMSVNSVICAWNPNSQLERIWYVAKPKEEFDPTGKSTKNIVYKDVLYRWLTVGILKPFYHSWIYIARQVLDIFIFGHVGKQFYFLGFIFYFILFALINI